MVRPDSFDKLMALTEMVYRRLVSVSDPEQMVAYRTPLDTWKNLLWKDSVVLAYEALIRTLVENSIPITQDIYDAAVVLGTDMACPKTSWQALIPLIAPDPTPITFDTDSGVMSVEVPVTAPITTLESDPIIEYEPNAQTEQQMPQNPYRPDPVPVEVSPLIAAGFHEAVVAFLNANGITHPDQLKGKSQAWFGSLPGVTRKVMTALRHAPASLGILP